MTKSAVNDRAELLDRYRVWKNERESVQTHISGALRKGLMSFEESQNAMLAYAETASKEEHFLLRKGMQWLHQYDAQCVDQVLEGPPSMFNSPRIWLGNDEDLPNIDVLMTHISKWSTPTPKGRSPAP